MSGDGIHRAETLRDLELASLHHGAAVGDVLKALLGDSKDEGIETVKLGRYEIRRRLGAGGMGAVYEAYDPKLERRIALKLLHADGVDDERLLAEGKAMAKLNHPNVVSVYDVDRDGDRVFVAMELVEGVTLRAWMAQSPRSWRDVLELYLEIGRGIVAAHAQDLVHCDLKPENVLVGDDGRPRVVDFGIALLTREPGDPREDESQGAAEPSNEGVTPSTFRGTPRYMSPEQFLHQPLDHRSDQFSLCSMLWEALYGARPFEGDDLISLGAHVTTGALRSPPPGRRIPSWLRHACERGLSTRPGERWPSVADLMTELRRGQARTQRRWALGALGLAAAAVVTVGAGNRLEHARRVDACNDAAAEIDQVWNTERRGAVESAIRATALPYAEFAAEHVGPSLDAEAAAWSDARRDACMAHTVDERWDDATAERSTWCLDEVRVAFEQRVAELASTSRQTVSRAAALASTRGNLEACTDPSRLRRLPLPAADLRPAIAEARGALAAVRAAADAGRLTSARDQSLELLPRVEALQWPPLHARVLNQLAHAEGRLGELDAAREHFLEGYFLAIRNEAPQAALEAAHGLMFVEGYDRARPEEGLVWARHAEVLLERLDATESGDAAAFHSARGHVLLRAGRNEEAREDYERALGVYADVRGELHPSVALARAALAGVARAEGKYDEAIVIGREVLRQEVERLGPDHPDLQHRYGEVAVALAMAGRTSEAIPLMESAVEIAKAADLSASPSFAESLATLAGMYATLEDHERARSMYERALEILEATVGGDHPKVALALNNLANTVKSDGNFADAEPLLRRALEILEHNQAPPMQRAVVMSNLADVNVQIERRDEAVALYERSLALREAELGVDHPRTAVVMVGLAGLANMNGDSERALQWAERALSISRGPNGVPDAYGRSAALVATIRWPDDPGGARDVAREARAALAQRGLDGAFELKRLDQWLADHPTED